MRGTFRFWISIFVIAILCTSFMEISVLAKKKPKRKRARTTAAKRTPTGLRLMLPPVIATASITENGVVTKDVVNTKPFEKRAKMKSPGTINATATAGQLIISEFRLSGPGLPGNGASPPLDEFIEIYNASGADHTVLALSGSGYGIAASDGVTRCTIGNGTVIASKGHFLCANTGGYSLGGYPDTDPVGPNSSYTADIPENSGIALFNNNTGGGSYSLANRLDAVGSASEANTLYKEGTGYPALTTFSLDYSFVRDTCGKGAASGNLGACTLGGLPKDTNNNAADFFFIDTSGTDAGAGQHLGAPGPQGLSNPTERNSSMSVTLLDPCVSKSSAPNRLRDVTADAPNNSTFGTLDIRRTVTNNTGVSVTKLRFRVADMTTKPAPGGVADLRVRSSSDIMVTVDRPPCDGSTSSVPVVGTTLADRFLFMGPAFQPNGGGLNALITTGSITLFSPLANGASVDLHFLLGVQQTGLFRFYINVEVFP